MPIYEYECEKCGERFEKRRTISDRDAVLECPECNDENTHRVCSIFGMVMAARPEFTNAGPT